MPQAIPPHTRNPLVALQVDATGWPSSPHAVQPLSYQDAILREICRAAQITHRSMTALSLSVAELSPSDPRHEAVSAAVSRLQPVWHDEVEQAWSLPAGGLPGVRDKAELLNLLIDRDQDGSVPGSPVLSLAASLAADVLRQLGGAAP